MHTCQETFGMVGDQYIRCGAPAKTLVQPRGRTEGPYWLCDEHADHYVRNRDCEDVTPEDERVREFIDVRVGKGSYRIDVRFLQEVCAMLSKLERQS